VLSSTVIVIASSVAYLAVLFMVALHADRRADAGRSLISNATVYALSLAVYCTSWTYYGSVGRATTTGVEFLAIYLGPTLMLSLGWSVLRKIIRISRRNRITSLADFISARYGKSTSLGALVTVMAVFGVVPYIALQLKAVSNTFEIIRGHPAITAASSELSKVPVLRDTALYTALFLAGFTILFGTRHLDATERHEGMVAAVAFDSIVKLVAFLAVGFFITFGMYGGFSHLFTRAAGAHISALFVLGGDSGYGGWIWLVILSMLAIVLLPRQWQIAVVENVDERHLKRAIWLFPLYLLVINIFVLPIAAAGLLRFGGTVNADTYVLALPMAESQQALALLVFIGGLSAATGMVIVETVALSTMVSNSLVMPLLLRANRQLVQRADVTSLVLGVRRATIVLVLLLGYAYFRLAGKGSALVSIGLVSFAAVAQFAPAILGGLFWKGGTRNGALAGLLAGFVAWTYTLLLPTFADAGWLSASILRDGPFGIRALAPQHLFGLSGMDPTSHGMFWSMLVNVGAYVAVSLAGRPTASERAQAVLFVEAFTDPEQPQRWRGPASIGEMRDLLERFVGPARAEETLRAYRDTPPTDAEPADPELVQHVETVLAGSVGSASARLVVAAVTGEEELRMDEVMEMIDHASHVAALEERHRLARELHDSVSQALFSMTMHTRAVELAVERDGGDPEGRVARGLAELRRLTQGALAEMRTSIFQLRPAALHEVGLVAALRERAEAITTREGIEVRVHAPAERLPLDARAEEEILRLVQEAMQNSVKHAGASRIDIRLVEPADETGALLIEISDDGTGFDPDIARPGHLGLRGMRERTEQIGGRLTIDSAPGRPTTVRAVLPGVLRSTEPGQPVMGDPDRPGR
jgi:Na+/proline symporter/two-component sensor histidine kinase